MEDKELTELKIKLKQGVYYVLVALLSITALIVFPLLDSSTLSFASAFPATPTGWTIWAIERALIVIMNLLILTLFIKQARVNVKDNEKYKKAIEILEKYKPKDYRPISPKEYYGKLYIRKGTTLSITTLASLIAIGDAVINYNYLLLVATAVTILFAVVFGIISMKDTEVYLITDFLTYCEELEKEKQKCLQSTEKNIETCKSKSRKTKKTSNTLSKKKEHSTNSVSQYAKK